ncbi:uncharacterized protein EI90DRAFT_3024031 [Cantharellus anzutake]|uniref:uncharacterized protein n=1 Tax=Cantharellus anzutake TaxID=1750568 RepID=UPI001906CAA0|nr:uncharacterized protein EI90DRAFT_3024031 [Cantharellus anzutake]KAF8310897.1 hypothetical protein EI90DRAFT_3024031 [Cantharellus anzutake]
MQKVTWNSQLLLLFHLGASEQLGVCTLPQHWENSPTPARSGEKHTYPASGVIPKHHVFSSRESGKRRRQVLETVVDFEDMLDIQVMMKPIVMSPLCGGHLVWDERVGKLTMWCQYKDRTTWRWLLRAPRVTASTFRVEVDMAELAGQIKLLIARPGPAPKIEQRTVATELGEKRLFIATKKQQNRGPAGYQLPWRLRWKAAQEQRGLVGRGISCGKTKAARVTCRIADLNLRSGIQDTFQSSTRIETVKHAPSSRWQLLNLSSNLEGALEVGALGA